MGLPRAKGWLKQFALGCVLGFVLTILAIVPIAIWGHASIRFHFSLHTLPRIGAVLLVLLLGALAEELMFRGYPFQHLEQGIGAIGAIAVFSVMFGAVHLANPGASLWGLINTILIGVLLSISYLRTPSFVATMGHSLRLEFRPGISLWSARKRPSAFQRYGADYGERAELDHRRQLRTGGQCHGRGRHPDGNCHGLETTSWRNWSRRRRWHITTASPPSNPDVHPNPGMSI